MDGSTGSGRAARLMEILGLSEDELCRTLESDPLTLLSGQLDHRPELPILLTMLNEALETADSSMLQRWVRASGPAGRPLDALVSRDFAAFEDALGDFSQRGFVIRGGGPDLRDAGPDLSGGGGPDLRDGGPDLSGGGPDLRGGEGKPGG